MAESTPCSGRRHERFDFFEPMLPTITAALSVRGPKRRPPAISSSVDGAIEAAPINLCAAACAVACERPSGRFACSSRYRCLSRRGSASCASIPAPCVRPRRRAWPSTASERQSKPALRRSRAVILPLDHHVVPNSARRSVNRYRAFRALARLFRGSNSISAIVSIYRYIYSIRDQGQCPRRRQFALSCCTAAAAR